MFNVHNYIKILEDGEQFDYPFERLKHVDKEVNGKKEEEKKEEPKIEEISEA